MDDKLYTKKLRKAKPNYYQYTNLYCCFWDNCFYNDLISKIDQLEFRLPLLIILTTIIGTLIIKKK